MRFRDSTEFRPHFGYQLLPFRFTRFPRGSESVLITSMSGQWLKIPMSKLRDFVSGQLVADEPLYSDLEANGFLLSSGAESTLAPQLAQIRTKRSFLFEGPSLHIFVVTLRCHHSCGYCQVSRQAQSAGQFDLRTDVLEQAVEALFRWPAKDFTVEFQGGEPLLSFDRIRSLTELILEKNDEFGRRITFVLASTLHDVSERQLAFFKAHGFKLSTSLDGPAHLHNANRPIPTKNSYEKTLAGIARAREVLGHDSVSALTTITRKSLEHPEEIVDEYVLHRFHSIFLRPLSPYGFAKKGRLRLGYGAEEFADFYRRAFERIVRHNLEGYALDEAYASLTLGQMLTPFSNGYVDIRSPSGAGFGAVIYDYDGSVYPSDEARMLAAMGDYTFRMGSVRDAPDVLLRSDAMAKVMRGAVAESIPQCTDCAFVPFCGADPIDSHARQRDEIGHRPSSEFCRRQTLFLEFLFSRWIDATADERAVLRRWIRSSTPASELEAE